MGTYLSKTANKLQNRLLLVFWYILFTGIHLSVGPSFRYSATLLVGNISETFKLFKIENSYLVATACFVG